MVDDSRRKTTERDTTDASLRTERRKTDKQLARTQKSTTDAAAAALADERDGADAARSAMRQHEDQSSVAKGASAQETRTLRHERAEEDALLTATRDDADAAAVDERVQRSFALASLLAFERHDTDMRLEIERMRADETLTSREDFLAIVSHDLRSLLGGIALRAGMLLRLPPGDDPGGKVARHAEFIQRFSARMNRLIGDLMDVASIQANKLTMVPGRHDATRLCRESVEAFRPAAAAQGITLTAETEDAPLIAEFDNERVLQVLTNLVGNALKFTGTGGHIAVRVEGQGDEVRFAVEDTGAGIPPNRLEKIFERYFQTDVDQRGLGLGLYIARAIIEAHGGTIWATSEVGRGSTFFFTLPRRAAPPRA